MKFSLVVAAALAVFAGPALAADHQIKMLNKGAEGVMVFEPSFVAAALGDTVTFVAADKGHDAVAIEGMLPEGATPFEGKMNEDLTITVDKPGFYGVKCKPHLPMGMVALVQVDGNASNLDAIASGKLPKKARERMDAALAKAKR